MKRISQILAKFILMVIALHFLAFLIVWAMNQFYLGSSNDSNVDYLKKNASRIDSTNISSSDELKIITENAQKTNLFLLGENHGMADVQRVDKILFLNLNRTLGVRFYIAEMDSLLGQRLTAFLLRPEKIEKDLREIIMEIKKTIPQQAGHEQFKKWSEIYDYNLTLPDSLKIEVIGIDINRDDDNNRISRDSVMFNNFVAQVENRNLEKEKFYGLFGYAHVLQAPVGENGYRPFAAIAKSARHEFTKNMKSIACYSLGSETYFPKNKQFRTPPNERTMLLNSDGPITLVKGIKDLDGATSSNSMTLFRLDVKNSPYFKGQDLAGVKVNFFGENILPTDPSAVTTDFIQYALLVRDSKAMTSIN